MRANIDGNIGSGGVVDRGVCVPGPIRGYRVGLSTRNIRTIRTDADYRSSVSVSADNRFSRKCSSLPFSIGKRNSPYIAASDALWRRANFFGHRGAKRRDHFPRCLSKNWVNSSKYSLLSGDGSARSYCACDWPSKMRSSASTPAARISRCTRTVLLRNRSRVPEVRTVGGKPRKSP